MADDYRPDPKLLVEDLVTSALPAGIDVHRLPPTRKGWQVLSLSMNGIEVKAFAEKEELNCIQVSMWVDGAEIMQTLANATNTSFIENEGDRLRYDPK